MRTCACLLVALLLAGCSSKESREAGTPARSGPGAAARAPSTPGGGPLPSELMNLPKHTGVWTRPDTSRRITAETIFDYMDGGGELYVGYRFDHLDVVEYTADDKSGGTILVEVYWMKSPLDAFGLLSTDWTGEPVAIRPVPSPTAQPRVETVPPYHALYGAGLLRLWAGTRYVRVLASHETPVSRDAVMKIARSLAGDEVAFPPAFLASVPSTTAASAKPNEKPGLPIRRERTCFLRSHLVLNSQYFLASENVLQLTPDTAAVTAEYQTSAPGALPLRLIEVRYPTAQAAAAAAKAFRSSYLPEAAKRQPASATRGDAKTEHGWVAWALEGAGLAIVLDAGDQAGARKLAEQAAGRVAVQHDTGG